MDPQKKDYFELYLEEKFKGLTTLVNSQFITVHDRQDSADKKLDLIHDETKATNSRVTHLEEQRDKYLETRVSTDMIKSCHDEIIEVKDAVKVINDDLEEYRIIKKYPKWALIVAAVIVIGLGISAYGTFRTINNSKGNKELLEKVKSLEKEVLTQKANG